MRILVTGSSGLLGAELVHLLSESGHEVHSGYGTHKPLAGNPIRLDLANLSHLQAVIEKARPELIFHAAAMTDVDMCERNPHLAKLVNGEATGKIAEKASQLGAYVIYLSTDYVFDGKRGEYKEEDQPHPINCYAESKFLGEQLIKESSARYCVARTSVLFGWGREHRPNFATLVLHRLRSGQPLKAATDQCASPTLNNNLAEMLIDLAGKRYEGILHLAGATPIDRYNFALQIAKTFDLDSILVEPVTSSEIEWVAKRPANSSLNVHKAIGVLDRKPLKLIQALDKFRASRSK